jgi:CheY-like chemotaxis protein
MTGKKAQEILRSENIDLVLLDVFLPDLNGVELMETVRDAMPKHMPIISKFLFFLHLKVIGMGKTQAWSG